MQQLVTLTVGPSNGPQDGRLRVQLSAQTEATWVGCLRRLDEHRLLSLVHFGLERAKLLDVVPPSIERLLRAQANYTQSTNQLRWLFLQGLVLRLRERGIVPTVCKGMVLAQRYYPSPATRYMNDIDLWIAEHELATTQSVLLEMGFVNLPETNLPHGCCYKNDIGLVVDLHHRMQILELLVDDQQDLTEEYAPKSFLVHEPHAFVAHLVTHFAGHVREVGPMLCWLLDLGYVVHKTQGRLDLNRLEVMLSRIGVWKEFLLSLRLLNEAFDMDLPEAILRLAKSLRPMSLEGILRQRRLALWGLPRPRGWARLLLAAMQRGQVDDRPWPAARDLVVWPFDRPHAQLSLSKLSGR